MTFRSPTKKGIPKWLSHSLLLVLKHLLAIAAPHRGDKHNARFTLVPSQQLKERIKSMANASSISVRPGLIRDFDAVNVPQYNARRGASQHSRDLACGGVRGGTRHGKNAALGKGFLEQTERVVGRAKVAPLQDAVRLIDDEPQRPAERAQERKEIGPHSFLRSN
mgnify:CR=1 FL=1